MKDLQWQNREERPDSLIKQEPGLFNQRLNGLDPFLRGLLTHIVLMEKYTLIRTVRLCGEEANLNNGMNG